MKDAIEAINAITKALADDTDCRGRGMWEATQILNAFCASRTGKPTTPVIPEPFTEQALAIGRSDTTITIYCEDLDDTDAVFDWLVELH